MKVFLLECEIDDYSSNIVGVFSTIEKATVEKDELEDQNPETTYFVTEWDVV